jgi:hypothetical protein
MTVATIYTIRCNSIKLLTKCIYVCASHDFENTVTCTSDYRRGLGLVIGFIDNLQIVAIIITIVLSLIRIIYNSLRHALSLFSLRCLQQSLLGNGFQRQIFPRTVGSRTISVPQLQTSNSKSARLNPSSLTDSL